MGRDWGRLLDGMAGHVCLYIPWGHLLTYSNGFPLWAILPFAVLIKMKLSRGCRLWLHFSLLNAMTALLIYILISYVCVCASVCECVCGKVIISCQGDHNKSSVRGRKRGRLSLRARQVLKLSKMSVKFHKNYV